MAKYTYEEKLAAAVRVVDKGMSCKSSALVLGTGEEQVRRWAKRYKEFGPEGLQVKHEHYDGAFKVSVIEYMHKHKLSLFQTAVKFGLPHDYTVGNWNRIYCQEGPEALYRDNRGRRKKEID